MKKFLCLLLVTVFSLGLLVGCNNNNGDSTVTGGSDSGNKDYVLDENGNYVYELFTDPKFTQGFNVGAANNSATSYPLDYDMLLPGAETYTWLCPQWGSKYGFGDSYGRIELTGHEPYEVECIDGEYQFEAYDPNGKVAHALRVNPTIGKITMDLDSSVEYVDEDGNITPRKTSSDYWPHILLSQGFTKMPLVSQLESFVLQADVSINRCVDLHPEGTYDTGLHAAQFLMYLVVKSTNDTEYMWFGIPFYDNRYVNFPEHDQIDTVENKFLYQVPGYAFAPNGVVADGTTINVNLDLKEYFGRALVIAQTKYGRFMSSTVDNLYVQSMNVGWEVPGVFDVSASISNYSIKAVSKQPL